MIRLITLLERLIDALQAQSAYSDVDDSVSFNASFDPAWAGFEVQTAGDLEIVTGGGNTVVISAEPGRIYPIAVAEIISTNTTVAASDVIGYIE